MNIYALQGHKVKVTEKSATAGYPDQSKRAKKLIGKVYTVAYTNVGGSHTSVYLEEFPSEAYDTVNFVDAEQQSERNDREHPDYATYN